MVAFCWFIFFMPFYIYKYSTVIMSLTLFLMFDGWQLSSPSLPFPFVTHLDKLVRKPRCSLHCHWLEIQTLKATAHMQNPHPTSSSQSKLSRSPYPHAPSLAVFGPAWEPATLYPESFLMWVIKHFIPSWYIGTIINLNTKPNLGGRPIPLTLASTMRMSAFISQTVISVFKD